MADFPRDFIVIAEERDRLRQELSIADEGLANYAQELNRVTQSNLQFIEANKSLADDNLALREQLHHIRNQSLEWAMCCPHDCPACDAMYEAIKGAAP